MITIFLEVAAGAWFVLQALTFMHALRGAVDSGLDIAALDTAGVSNGRRRIAAAARSNQLHRAWAAALYGGGGLAATLVIAGVIPEHPAVTVIQATTFVAAAWVHEHAARAANRIRASLIAGARDET